MHMQGALQIKLNVIVKIILSEDVKPIQRRGCKSERPMEIDGAQNVNACVPMKRNHSKEQGKDGV